MQNQRVRQRTEEDRGLQDNLKVGTNKVQEMKHPILLHLATEGILQSDPSNTRHRMEELLTCPIAWTAV